MSGTDLVIKDKNFNERIQYNPVIGKSKERVDKCMNKIKEEIDKHNLNLIGVVPMDEMIYEYDSSGIPLVNLPEDSKAKIAINDIMAKLELN